MSSPTTSDITAAAERLKTATEAYRKAQDELHAAENDLRKIELSSIKASETRELRFNGGHAAYAIGVPQSVVITWAKRLSGEWDPIKLNDQALTTAPDDGPVTVEWIDENFPELVTDHFTIQRRYMITPQIVVVADACEGGWKPCVLWVLDKHQTKERPITKSQVRQLAAILKGE